MTDTQTLSQSQRSPTKPTPLPSEPTTGVTRARPRFNVTVWLLLLAVLLLGAYFRFLNVDWDEGEHLHPDERYMTMVTGGIRWPGPVDNPQPPPPGCMEWGGYFDSYCSPLNPYNRNYGSYAYGTLPLFGARFVGEWLNGACIDPAAPEAEPAPLKRAMAGLLFQDVEGCIGDRFTGYGHIHLIGRMLSALADLGAVFFIFMIGRRLYSPWVGLLAAALHALAVLPIQQSHFYTVDAFAGFFITLAGYFTIRAAQSGRWRDFGIAGLGFGLALACKVSVWPFAAIIILAALLYYARRQRTDHPPAETPPDDQEIGRHSPVLNGLMALLLLILCFLIFAIAVFGIWSAVKIAFYAAIALLFVGGAAFYIYRPGAGYGVSVDRLLLRLVLAGLLAFIAFRIAQPYAFVGTHFESERWQAPEYDWVRGNVPEIWYTLEEKLPGPLRTLFLPDPRFVGTLASVNRQLTGEADVPWGHQWTNRLPFLFPWVNMVVWGMGLPLGLIAWAGWALAAWELWRGQRRMQHFIPWAWATLLFFYQGTQWVKSIRYLLPTYPFLILLGAWLLVRLWRRASVPAKRIPWARLRPLLYRLPLLAVLAGTLLWAWGFTRIYTRPVTRNAASRWMVQNIPTAATLHYQAEGQEKTYFLRLPPSHVYTTETPSQTLRFFPPEDGTFTGITFTHLGDPELDAAPESFQVTLSADMEGQIVLAQTERTLYLEEAQHRLGDAQYFPLGPVSLSGTEEYYLTLQATDGAPVRLDTTVIANEYPDDSLPTRVDGRDPFGSMYRGLQSAGDGKTHWDLNEDTSKLSQALEWLDEADIIALSSNRGYASIPRMPSRYPLAIEYYRALFAEELGFELIATFTSYPTIGPFQFPDQETPFPPGEPALVDDQMGRVSVYLPPAEEAFSVYDHPQVFLFRKTADYSRQRAEAILGRVDLSQVVWMKPTEATLAPTALMMTPEEIGAQRHGGTWTDIFDADGWLNRSPWLSVIVWWLLIQALGLAVFPLLFLIAPGLRDRGWPLAKTLGLVLLATLVWLAGSTHWLSYSRGLILFTGLCLCVLGGALAWWQRRHLAAWIARQRRAILVSELLFSGMYVLFLLIRYGNPDLWHPVMGGERPMDLAYLNAVIKSTHFPPYDPWFAGGYLNYYYFGFVIVGTPIKLLGILPEIAYNLALPTFFALTGVGAYSVAYNLVARKTNKETQNNDRLRRAIYAGLLAALFVAVLGNLSEIHLVVDGLYELGARDFEFDSTIPGLEPLVTTLRGLGKLVLGGETMPWRPEWPYWNASRAIPHLEGEAPPITEFPFFTFLYSDLHAHLLALPLNLLALALSLNWTLDGSFWQTAASRWRRRLVTALGLVIGGIVIGALRPTNTWDYYTFLTLPLLTLSLGYWIHRVKPHPPQPSMTTLKNAVLAVGGRLAVLAALSALFYLPYINRYATAYSSFELWKGSKTPLWSYLVVHGLFLFPILTWLLLRLWRSPAAVEKVKAWLRAPFEPMAHLLVTGGLTALLGAMLLALAMGYSIAPLVLPAGILTLLALTRRQMDLTERLVALLSGVGLALTILVEVIVVKGDISRMNTVFKFYLQVWLLFGTSAAACTIWVLGTIPKRKHHPAPEADPLSAPDTAPDTDGHPDAVPAAGGTSVPDDTPPPVASEHTGRATEPLPATRSTPTRWRIWKGVLVLLVALAALYPILATRAKIHDRWAREVGPGLNGMAWMKAVSDVQYGPGAPDGERFSLEWDYQALLWLRENIHGSPVVAEGAEAQPYRSLRARVATYTGLPIIIGYPWHQTQQRSILKTDLVNQRERDVDQLYNTPDPWLAKEILDRYEVSLVYLGDLERITYEPVGIQKFKKMAELGLLHPVYTNEGVNIYEVVR